MIVNGNLLAQVSHCVVGDLHRVPVEQLAQRVTLGDGAVQDPQELTWSRHGHPTYFMHHYY